MSDDKTKTAHDRKLISLSEPYELRDWTRSLGVSGEESRKGPLRLSAAPPTRCANT